LRSKIVEWIAAGKSGVLACSALKRAYRQRLQAGPEVRVVYLKGELPLLQRRMRARRGHFMTEQMLESQLATLEEPEDAVVVDVGWSPERIVREIQRRLSVTGNP
jgi:gluconokinase